MHSQIDTTLKTLIPNKTWILESEGIKVGTVFKKKKGYEIYRDGNKIKIQTLADLSAKFGCSVKFENKAWSTPINTKAIYGYPCSVTPVDPVYNVIKKLPLFAKSKLGQSLYCAGYYIVMFSGGWVKSFCPKLSTIESYPYKGPFMTENEAKLELTAARLCK